MARIAVLGATSRIAMDLISSMMRQARHSLALFSRRPQELQAWLAREQMPGTSVSLTYDAFGHGEFDVIMNFVGAGDPARTAEMGGSILDVTYEFDSLALNYIRRNPQTRYIFMSSGAAYGSTFLQAVGAETLATLPINSLSATDFYSMAKIHAECRHRAMIGAAIIDIRIFSYFSRTSDMAARFFTTDIVRAIHDKTILHVGEASMRRDFLVPRDFAQLVDCVLNAPRVNLPIDAYSRAPVEKFELLRRMSDEFGLRYEIVPTAPVILATGAKPNYYSVNRRAAEYGYAPLFGSIDGVVSEARAMLLAV
jgi:nucleoside-diphosphate-sugar epimerase